ncbi:hypothetical protein GCM10011452_09180 [Gemmobacter lanyuensis]|uniref:Uncharacterized protein n=1 Tax=Gemmobacter lanyuensis TaxID=1054497 RepID=A0A918INP1_9RHOB|nr:gene transfer agent family protein [Gemmobacter lanyuensis]GGW23973.1 hypothetical protein GCM10011452_09180 [Gemmobacter lanyuensis]
MELIREFAGRERKFALRFGEILDLEQACGDGKDPAPIGVIFQRLSMSRFAARDVYHTIRLGLIGGGMDALRAKSLIDDRLSAGAGFMGMADLALDLLMHVMAGIEGSETAAPERQEPRPLRLSDVAMICQTLGMTPSDLRQTRYADFVNMVRGFNAAGKTQVAPMSEDEFAEILAKYEPET